MVATTRLRIMAVIEAMARIGIAPKAVPSLWKLALSGARSRHMRGKESRSGGAAWSRLPCGVPWFLGSSRRQSSSVLPRREVVERLVQSLIVAVRDPIRDRSEGGQNR